MVLTLCNRAYNNPLALLALCVFTHGTLLAPQVVMGPECNAFEGIASSGFRAFCVERKPKRSVQAAMIKHAAEARRELLRGALNGSIWVLGAPVRLTKSALRVLTSPIRLVVNEAIAQITRRDTGSNDARSFPDLGVGTRLR